MALDPAMIRLEDVAREGTIHFMGIGGAGMSPLAELMLRNGAAVSGCDLRPGPSIDGLVARGAEISTGHDASHLGGAAALVVTSAVPADHPEVVAAHALGIPVLKRAQALGSVVNQAQLVGVAGTHGKTSTTAMTVEVLRVAGLNPTGLVGGRVVGWSGNLHMGSSDLYVVEADEFDRSFLTLRPDVAVVTTLEADHLDTYGDLDGVTRAFARFVHQVPVGGRVVVCGDDHGASRLLATLNGRGYSYGTRAGSQLRAVALSHSPGGSAFDVLEDGSEQGRMTLSVPGRHNVRNALAAAAVARTLGAGWDAIRAGLASYRGVARRFQVLGEPRGVLVIDDYAHHPTEIEATLDAVVRAHPGRRVVAVFQPHLFSRTRDFSRRFGRVLSRADVAWITDVYPAREEPIEGIDGSVVAAAVRAEGDAEVRYEPALDRLGAELAESLERGDVCVIMGAGSIESLGADLLALLEAEHG